MPLPLTHKPMGLIRSPGDLHHFGLSLIQMQQGQALLESLERGQGRIAFTDSELESKRRIMIEEAMPVPAASEFNDNRLEAFVESFEQAQSAYSVYAWWLLLRLVFNTFWNARQQAIKQAKDEDDTEDPGA